MNKLYLADDPPVFDGPQNQLMAPLQSSLVDKVTDKTKYCVGFLFNQECSRVALVRKARPDWQKGKLNGIGGHVEEGESFIEAMRREYEEETGQRTPDWHVFCEMEGPDWTVFCFWAIGRPVWNRYLDEPIEVIKVKELHGMTKHETIGNIPWLVAMALNKIVGEFSPAIAHVIYA